MNVAVYSTSKIVSLSQGTDCFKLTVKEIESQNERSGKGEKGDCSCGRSVFAVCFHWNTLWLLVEFPLGGQLKAECGCRMECMRSAELGEPHQGLCSS